MRVFCDASDIVLDVIDQGCGMSLPEGRAAGYDSKGTGIVEMGERMRHVGGRLEITSGSDGTKVRARLASVQRQPDIEYGGAPQPVP